MLTSLEVENLPGTTGYPSERTGDLVALAEYHVQKGASVAISLQAPLPGLDEDHGWRTIQLSKDVTHKRPFQSKRGELLFCKGGR